VSSDKLEEVKTEAAGDTPADASVAGTPAGDTTPAAIPAAPLSTASIYPVHAWQYDELVFSDPPANFLAILEEHPPTPLPARNRRPRDQRADHDARTGKKKRKPVTSRAGTATPATPRARTPATAPGTPTAAVAAGTVGIPGEPGSADVPLEYSLEMEKAEYARLTDVRMRIVDQMDRWRERLIAQERDMNRIKEDMKAHAH
jgi:YEATS domain-containing protein 4